MSRIFITGSTEGLGLAAARTLMDQGHEVVIHARSAARAATLGAVASLALKVVIGDLSSATQARDIAWQVNALGSMDVVIHNAGVYGESQRRATPEGHAETLAVNSLAPYILTALIERPRRLIYLSSSMHRGGDASLRDIDWTERRWDRERAYSDSKLYVTAMALAMARLWPDVISQAVDPGWVPTRMGGPQAPDDLEWGHQTQTWLAVSDESPVLSGGGYWHHRARHHPAPQADDETFQDRLLALFESLTGVAVK